MRRTLRVLIPLVAIAGVGFLLFRTATNHKNKPDGPLKVPQGFSLEIFAKDLPGARVMVRDLFGNMWVSQTSKGTVSLLEVDKETGKVSSASVILKNLKHPHGILFGAGEQSTALYVAEENQIIRIATYSDQEKPDILVSLPDDGGHYTRTIAWLPGYENEKMLVSVGSSCNVCNETDERRAKILLLNVKTGTVEEFARGLRNTVFMATHPVTGEIWGTDMGRDNLGDDIPPDEINIICSPSMYSGQNFSPKNFGWPNCYGKNIHDTDFDKNTYIRNPCMEPFETPSHIDIPAHSAPLGIAFVPEEGWPKAWWHNALVAYHGSWNRSEKTGYKIVRFPLDPQGNPIGDPVDFVTGFLVGDTAIGRPVGLLIEPGSALYISDDAAGMIYKLSRKSS